MGTYYGDSVPPRNRQGMRTGYTTGSSAAAAARAATVALLTGTWPEQVTITLPIGETATLTPVENRLDAEAAFCCIVKDGGDDPDVTHGALICAQVRHTSTPGIALEGGEGVGRVTLPGLGLPVGEAAINPVPREQIRANVTDAVRDLYPDDPDYLERYGLDIVISVPNGAEIARKTLNPRLGIVGGISILGTTGKVFPYSTAAWRESVVKAVELAAYNSRDRVVLATGARSERYAMQLFPDLPEVAFVEMSIFTGAALKTCIAQGVRAVTFVAMISRIIKTARGQMVTHVAGSPVEFDFLAQICREVGAPDDLVDAVARANTARHVLELCQERDYMTPVQRLVDLALEQCMQFVKQNDGAVELDVILVGFDGAVLATAGRNESSSPSVKESSSPTDRLTD